MSNVVAAAQVKGSKTLEKNLVVVLKYRNGLRVVSQESCWQVRGFLFWLVTPAIRHRALPEEAEPSSDTAQLFLGSLHLSFSNFSSDFEPG